MRIVLLGAPGAGKGTQCKQIITKYGLEHLSSGDILRRERSKGSELGKKAESYMDSGALVPDGLIVEMMAGAVEDASESGFVLDGFPRTVNQAEALDQALDSMGQKIDLVLNLAVDDGAVVARITGRRSCPKCGAVYHIENLKPKVEGICDVDGAELVQRADDTAEVVENRLANYHRQTEPVIDYYKNSAGSIGFFEIDANDDVDKVRDLVIDKLESFVNSDK